MPWEKVFQATADEKVAHSQFGKHQGSSLRQTWKPSTFKVKADIKLALFLVEEAKAALVDLELGHAVKKLCRRLLRTTKTLKSAWV